MGAGEAYEAQQPLARVVVGGMVTAPSAILLLIPVFAAYWLRPNSADRGDAAVSGV